MGKRMARLSNGCVERILWCADGQPESDRLKNTGAVPVAVGDQWDGSHFIRDGQRVLTPLEAAEETIAELDAALLEMQYQNLIGGLSE